MFPSQRGNFFPIHKNKRSRSKIGQRLKSPPLGVSATMHLQSVPLPMSQQVKDRTLIPSTFSIGPIDTLSKSRQEVSTSKFSLSKYYNNSSKKLQTTDNSESSTQVFNKFNSTVNPSRVVMSRIPSSWSNQPWSATDPYFQYNLRHGVDISSISSNSKIVCNNKEANCGKLSPKIQQERDLITKLCDDALKTRRDARAFYSSIYDEELSETNTRLSNFDPKNHKGRICEFMLKLVTERQQLLEDRRAPFYDTQNLSLKGNDDAVKPGYTPLFCLDGKVLLGKPHDSISFPNSFAPLAELYHPKDDPKGYRRFCTLVNLKGFQDNEIFFRVTAKGACLIVDGARLKKSESTTEHSKVRVLSTYIELPKGVYPDRLKIGRSTTGILVIQESWKF